MPSQRSVSASDLALLGKCECMVSKKSQGSRTKNKNISSPRPKTIQMHKGEVEHSRFEAEIQQHIPAYQDSLSAPEKRSRSKEAALLACTLIIITTVVAFS